MADKKPDGFVPDTPSTETPDYGYGNRFGTNTPKGLGFLGPLRRDDGDVMSEYSIGVKIGGKETEIPTLVPTLTKQEVQKILSMKDGDKLPESIVQKARAHAEGRLKEGRDLFAGPGEQQSLYPELRRAAIPRTKAPGGFMPDAAPVYAPDPRATLAGHVPQTIDDSQPADWKADLNAALQPYAHPQTVDDIGHLLMMGSREAGEALGQGVAAVAAPVARVIGKIPLPSFKTVRRGVEIARHPVREGVKALADEFLSRTAPAAEAAEAAPAASSATPATVAATETVAAPVVAPASSSPAAAATAAKSPQQILNEEAIAARRATYQATLKPVAEAAKDLQTAVTQAASKPKLTAAEALAGLELIRKGLSSEKALELVLAQREFNARMGLKVPTVAQTRFPKGMRDMGAPFRIQ